jgi:hypothetical protein
VTFSVVRTELLALPTTTTPSAKDIESAYTARATKLETGNADLTYPPPRTRPGFVA